MPRMANENDRSFVAINYITCKTGYRERFEELFATRARAIDRMPGFQHMEVLQPQADGDHYLIVSHWDSEDNFSRWTNSPEFREGHQRGFEDIKLARERGEEPPMSSDFKTYKVIAR